MKQRENTPVDYSPSTDKTWLPGHTDTRRQCIRQHKKHLIIVPPLLQGAPYLIKTPSNMKTYNRNYLLLSIA